MSFCHALQIGLYQSLCSLIYLYSGMEKYTSNGNEKETKL